MKLLIAAGADLFVTDYVFPLPTLPSLMICSDWQIPPRLQSLMSELSSCETIT
jgi:hypothetical protein